MLFVKKLYASLPTNPHAFGYHTYSASMLGSDFTYKLVYPRLHADLTSSLFQFGELNTVSVSLVLSDRLTYCDWEESWIIFGPGGLRPRIVQRNNHMLGALFDNDVCSRTYGHLRQDIFTLDNRTEYVMASTERMFTRRVVPTFIITDI